MPSEVGSGQVAIFPTFKGFRRAVDGEVKVSANSARSTFSSTFKAAGTESGRNFSQGFKATGSIDSLTKAASAAVAKASREVANSRLREQDAAGKVRLAETQLRDARQRYASDSVQVVRAEERLAAAERQVANTADTTRGATERLAAAKRDLERATLAASSAGTRMGGSFAQLPTILGDSGQRSARLFSQGFLNVLGGALGANILTGVGFTIGRTINQGISAGISLAFEGVQLASDLSETRSAIKQVFGPTAAAEIVAFSETANQALGSTRQQALLGAQTFGVFGRSAGLVDEPLSTFSTKLVTLAGDLASFYNTSPEDAIQALSAGLRGESEPLRRYGVLLDDATLRQRALSLGIYDGSGALTQQQRILAAQAEIMAQTSLAQGDFARTSDGLANQQRILAASLQDTQAKLGEYLLPAFTSAATFANQTLVPRLGEVIDKVGPKLAAALESSAPAVGNLLDKVQPLVEDFITWAGEDGIPAVISGMSDLADAVPGWANAFQGLTDPGNPLDDFNNWLKDVADQINGDNGLVNDLVAWLSSDDVARSGFVTGEYFGQQTGAGVKSGLRASDPLGISAFGIDGKPKFDFLTYGTGVGDSVGGGAKQGLQQSDPFGFDVFGLTEDKVTLARQYGENFGQSVVDGINSKGKAIGRAGSSLATQAVTAVKKVWDIRSPSHVGTDLGSNYAGSITDAMLAGVKDSAAAGQALATAAVTGATLRAGTSDSALARSSAQEHTWNLNGVDPLVVASMVKQELAGRLATLP